MRFFNRTKEAPMTKYLLTSFLLLLVTFPANAQTEENTPSPLVTEIQSSLDEYVAVFNRGDAEALAQLWTEDATYVPSSGDPVTGRAEILKSYRQMFESNPGVKMEVADSGIEPATEGWAYEFGTDLLTYADGSVEESPYLALLKKVGDKWLIASVTDLEPAGSPSLYEVLRSLEWLIGSWQDETDGTIVETTYEWSSKGNSILGKVSIVRDGALEKDGLIVIGWDPIDQAIRSWTFDSEGGTAEGVWYEKNGKWFSKALHVLPDGGTGSSTRVFEKVDENTLRWRAVNRELDGEMLPTVGPITLTRVASGH
jgi:uncharacterized protein (TIGR02246 family)